MPSFNIPGMPPYRIVERTLLTSAAEHGKQSLMVYNTHQPASSNRTFNPASRVKVTKAMIEYGIRDANNYDTLVAVLCVGDANFNRSTWMTVSHEVSSWKLHFHQMPFTFATQAIARRPHKMKPGDISMAMTMRGVDVI